MKSIERYILEGSKFVVFVMCGLPGSGKSTWAKENHPDLTIVSRDVIRAKLAKKKQSFIVDDTNSIPKYRKELLQTLRNYGAKIIGVNVETPIEVCINRRRGQIPKETMERLAAKRLPLRKEDVDDLLNVKGY